MKKIFLNAFLLFFVSYSVIASSIVAVVNDNPISAYDVENRMNMILLTSRIKRTEENLSDLRNKVIEALIDEKIKLEEAKSNGISLNDDEVNNAIYKIEQQGKMEKGLFRTFLEMNKVPPLTIDNFIIPDLSWYKLVAKKFSNEAIISEAELNAEIEKIEANFKKDRNLISEIFLSVKSEKDEAKVKQKINNIYKELKDGADFGVIAKNFSESITSINDGNVGWVNVGSMEKPLEDALKDMSVDDISKPIRSMYGYYILTIKDKRKAYEGVERLYSISRIVYEEDKEQEILDKVNSLDKKTCNAFNDYAYSFKNESGEMIVSKLEDFPEEFKTVIEKMKTFDVSKPFEFDDKKNILMYCKDETKFPIPDREVIRQAIASSRLEQIANRYFRDLKRNAVIKVK
ncbi:MAG: Chaperone SurA precursor [Alphaproteobacteria bacterium ADurb.Bin438]|nr:MAG: Chaperone SurA precursor [Alphaproteobacteria bacterium ADurb.Bin438]